MMGHSVLDIWNTMGPLAQGIALMKVCMSIYSFGVFIERYLFFRAAKKQSIDYLPLATKALREGNYNAAVDASKRFSKSHLAKVLAAGLQQFLFEREEEPTGPPAVPEPRQRRVRPETYRPARSRDVVALPCGRPPRPSPRCLPGAGSHSTNRSGPRARTQWDRSFGRQATLGAESPFDLCLSLPRNGESTAGSFQQAQFERIL